MDITFTYEMNEKETKLNKLQMMCKVMEETLEELEAMRGTVDDEELNKAIEEANEEYNRYEEEIIKITWGV